MDRNLQIWLLFVSLALIASVTMQIVIIGIFIRLLALMRPTPGRHGLGEVADRALEAIEATDKVLKTTVEILDKIKPVVDEAATVSIRQMSHADQVVGDVLTGVDNINRDVNSVITWPFREVRALSAGARTAVAAFFKINSNGGKVKRW